MTTSHRMAYFCSIENERRFKCPLERMQILPVTSLGYIGLGVKDIGAWRSFATDVLGVQVDEAGDRGLHLRVDSRAWRIAIEPTGEDDITYVGWDVGGPAALDAIVARLEAAGTPVVRDDGQLAKTRRVMGIASFVDPSGIKGELYWGATEQAERPFVSAVGVRGFVTGAQGLGHIVVGAENMNDMHRFYGDLLGFGFSDRIDMRMGPGVIVPVDFLHCNRRHHTLAFAPTPPDAQRLIHFMLEVDNFDDVGFAIDRAEQHGVAFATTLGRHSNDRMLSFYAYTPSGFEVEIGFGGLEIDPKEWVPARHDVTSNWGHKFIGHGAQRG